MKMKITFTNQVLDSARRWSSSFSLFRRGKLKLELQRGFLEVDLVVGMAILSLAIVPLGFSFARERQVLKIEYARSVANEIVDGEMEILAAGDWKNFPDGAQNYSVRASAAATLPPGHFQLTKTGNHLRLEWIPDGKHGVGAIVREITVK
jgi:hypothetical protein